MFKVGDEVHIKSDAFPDAVPGSAAYVARGRAGIVRFSDASRLIKVQVDDISYTWFVHCEEDELEPIDKEAP